jgi:hypothetical protein
VTLPDVAYYYPAPYWGANEGSWIKSLLLFFDRVAILLPDYMYGRHSDADPSLVEPLEDGGLLEILEPKQWVDQEVTEQLATVVVDLLTNGVFDDLPDPPGDRFHALSYSRMGYGADVELSQMLVDELEARHLARETEDGVSVPLHPVVRTTILVILGQLARAVGERRGMTIHPTTNDHQAMTDLVQIVAREPMPSAGHVVTFDLEAVSLDLDTVPLDDVLAFREDERAAHRAYMRSLRGFLSEIAQTDDVEERKSLLLHRQEEIADAAHALRSKARRAFARTGASWSLGLAGAVWSVLGRDILSVILGGSSLVGGSVPGTRDFPNAYSYVFAAARRL